MIARIAALDRRPEAVFTNSDHLQVQAALAADWFGLPGKGWRAALLTKNKAQMRRALAEAGLETVWSAELTRPGDAEDVRPPFPCVVKPREGVASEDAELVEDRAELLRHCRVVWSRRPGLPLVVEEYLTGPLRTLETLGGTDASCTSSVPSMKWMSCHRTSSCGAPICCLRRPGRTWNRSSHGSRPSVSGSAPATPSSWSRASGSA
ncbi:hypothetical protein GCM10020000_03750 [Streptomyces olivoverticillatus]